MKIKTNELTGAALDWAVAQAEGLLAFGYRTDGARFAVEDSDGNVEGFMPSTDWAQGGPVIEREKISIQELEGIWSAFFRDKLFEEDNSECWRDGPTPLIAAMRCYVASKLGAEVDVPEELK